MTKEALLVLALMRKIPATSFAKSGLIDGMTRQKNGSVTPGRTEAALSELIRAKLVSCTGKRFWLTAKGKRLELETT